MEKYLYQDLYSVENNHWWHKAKRKICKDFIFRFINKSEIKILDVGCGTGKNMEFFSSFSECWGIDSSEDAISFCKKRGLTKIKNSTAENSKFKNLEFDVITMLDVLEHVEEKPTLTEIHRILKEGGYIIITVPAFSWLWSKWDEVLHHKRRYTKESLVQVLEKNGFSITKVSYMYSFLIIPALIFRTIKSFFYESPHDLTVGVSSRNRTSSDFGQPATLQSGFYGDKDQYPSDFKISSPFLNSLFGAISKIESYFINRTGVPIGTSLICIAQRTNLNDK